MSTRGSHKFTSIVKFAQDWVEQRNKAVSIEEKRYKVSTILDIIRKYYETGSPKKAKNKGGKPYKITQDTIRCLVASVLDFPDATDQERTLYLNTYGPNHDVHISESTVNIILNNLKITVQKPCFSPKERNSLGFVIARYVWSKVMEELLHVSNILVVFIDEASVTLNRRKNARGFISITPIVTRSCREKKYSKYNMHCSKLWHNLQMVQRNNMQQ